MNIFETKPPQEILDAAEIVSNWMISNDKQDYSIYGLGIKTPEKETKPGTTHGCRIERIETQMTTMQMDIENLRNTVDASFRGVDFKVDMGKPFTKVDMPEIGDKVTVSGFGHHDGEYEVTANYGRVDGLLEQVAELQEENTRIDKELGRYRQLWHQDSDNMNALGKSYNQLRNLINRYRSLNLLDDDFHKNLAEIDIDVDAFLSGGDHVG